MRRTEQEFKAEILRRSSAYRQRRKKRLKNTLMSLGCFAVLIFGIQLLPAGFGGATECAVEPMEEMKVDQLAPEVMENLICDISPGVHEEESESCAEGSNLYGKDADATIRVDTQPEGDIICTITPGEPAEEPETDTAASIRIETRPEREKYVRTFTDPAQIAAIEQVICDFRAHGTVPEENPGDAEGMAYVITVTNAEGEMSFTLFNYALYSEPDGCWYSSPECYQALLELILQEPNE